jgi:hypothetical protein
MEQFTCWPLLTPLWTSVNLTNPYWPWLTSNDLCSPTVYWHLLTSVDLNWSIFASTDLYCPLFCQFFLENCFSSPWITFSDLFLPGRRCSSAACPRACEWGDYGAWSTCSKTCGGGTRTRQRLVVRRAEAGGRECEGEAQEVQFCGTESCSDATTTGRESLAPPAVSTLLREPEDRPFPN